MKDGEEDPNKALIVLLSTSANIVSKHCAMVGVDKSGKVTGSMQTRHVPTSAQAMPMGFGMPMMQQQAMCFASPPSMPMFGAVSIFTITIGHVHGNCLDHISRNQDFFLLYCDLHILVLL